MSELQKEYGYFCPILSQLFSPVRSDFTRGRGYADMYLKNSTISHRTHALLLRVEGAYNLFFTYLPEGPRASLGL